MSIPLVTLAFKTTLPSTQKFVLVALCDSADDRGECYPRISTLMAKCSLSERAVQTAIAALESLGFVRREFRTGRSTVYWIDAAPAPDAPRTTCTPAVGAPPHDVHPGPAPDAPRGAPAAPQPPHDVRPAPAPDAPITVNEPSVETSPDRKRKRATPESVDASLLVAAGFDAQTAAEFIACKVERKAPLTPRAWADHQREAANAGWTPLQAAEKVMAKTWKGFEAKYVANERIAARVPLFKESRDYGIGVTSDGAFTA